MACSVKLCLRFSAHVLFLAVKHKQLFLARTMVPGVLLVISMNYKKRTKMKSDVKLMSMSLGVTCSTTL